MRRADQSFKATLTKKVVTQVRTKVRNPLSLAPPLLIARRSELAFVKSALRNKQRKRSEKLSAKPYDKSMRSGASVKKRDVKRRKKTRCKVAKKPPKRTMMSSMRAVKMEKINRTSHQAKLRRLVVLKKMK